MKKILSILFVFCSFAANSQVLQEYKNFGGSYPNFRVKDAFLLPTGCGAPASLDSAISKYKQGAIYIDSCAGLLYVWNPSTKVWAVVSGGGTTTNHPHDVQTISEMLALDSVVVGDIATVADSSKSYVLKTLPASTFANWLPLLNPVLGSTDYLPEGITNKYNVQSNWDSMSGLSAILNKPVLIDSFNIQKTVDLDTLNKVIQYSNGVPKEVGVIITPAPVTFDVIGVLKIDSISPKHFQFSVNTSNDSAFANADSVSVPTTLAVKNYFKNHDNQVVHVTGTENIGGSKTFTSAIAFTNGTNSGLLSPSAIDFNRSANFYNNNYAGGVTVFASDQFQFRNRKSTVTSMFIDSSLVRVYTPFSLQNIARDTGSYVVIGGPDYSLKKRTIADVKADLGMLQKIQTFTTGTAVTVADSTTWIIIDPAATLSTLTITLPTPSANRVVDISFGGTLKGYNDQVVTTLTISATGYDIVGTGTLGAVTARDKLSFRYNSSNLKWYRN
ncbi:MAG TPA: hypothetical protein VIM07_15180 [Chitinophagaceae bacterium]